MDLEALRQKALLSLKRSKSTSEPTENIENIVKARNNNISKTHRSTESFEYHQEREEGELSPEKESFIRPYKRTKTDFKTSNRHRNATLYSYRRESRWDQSSLPDLLGKLDDLLQIVHQAEATEAALKQRLSECRQVRKNAERQLHSLQRHLESTSLSSNSSLKRIERVDRLPVHLLMQDSSLLWFPTRFKSHPAYLSFVIHPDTPTFNHRPFDPNLPFCLDEVCFGKCSCESVAKSTPGELEEGEVEEVHVNSFNHLGDILP